MSASRCLGPAVTALRGAPRGQWKAYIDALPVVCPHGDCTAKPGCRGHVADYFRMQWRIRVLQEQLEQRKTLRDGAMSHG